MIQCLARAGAGTCLAFFALACDKGDTASPPVASPAAIQDSEIAAEVNGVPIPTAELDAWIKEDLFRSQAPTPARLYELRERGLERLLEERLLEIEASRRGVSPEELIQLEVDALGAVTHEEVAEFYEERRAQMGGATLEELQTPIREFLLVRRKSDAVAKLRERANVTIHLEPPRLEVATDGPFKGPADAPVTIVEFCDFQCPFCRRALATIDGILARYPQEVRLVYRHLPLRAHQRARAAAEAALCAQDQERFWPYHDKLFENSRNLEDQDLLRYAREVGLDAQRFERCLAEHKFARRVDGDVDEARSVGITRTPSFVVNGVLISGARPLEEFTQVIDAELARLADPESS